MKPTVHPEATNDLQPAKGTEDWVSPLSYRIRDYPEIHCKGFESAWKPNETDIIHLMLGGFIYVEGMTSRGMPPIKVRAGEAPVGDDVGERTGNAFIQLLAFQQTRIAALEVVIEAMTKAHDDRVRELLAANNVDVERRRAAEAKLFDGMSGV